MGILLIKEIWESIRCPGGEVLNFATYYQLLIQFKSALEKIHLIRIVQWKSWWYQFALSHKKRIL